MSLRSVLGILLVLVVVGGGAYTVSQFASGSAEAGDRKEVRWLLSHTPTELFDRAADIFKTELEKRSGGTMTLRIVTPDDLGQTGDIPNTEALQYIADGTADLATVYTTGLGEKNPDLYAMNLPFLFDDYAAVNQALDGSLGDALLARLSSTHGVVGLAFTMSGGLRILVSKDLVIDSADDLAGKRVITAAGPVAEATLRALGAEPVSSSAEYATEGAIDAIETTYSRLDRLTDSAYTARIHETYHSVFLTTIVASKGFFDSLTPTEQSALRAAAKEAARIEREDSEALGVTTRARLLSQGSTITALPSDIRSEWVARTGAVYDQFVGGLSSAVVGALDL